MKSQDIVILLKLVSLQEQEEHQEDEWLQLESQGGDPYSVRNLEASLGISKTEISQAIKRSISSGIATKDGQSGRPRPSRRNILDFILHGFRFVFPANAGAMQRGIPTAFAAPMLKDLLISGGNYIYVWPHPSGRDLGQSIDPLFKTVPEAALRDARLYEYLALADAIRLGNQREVGVASEYLSSRLQQK
ncbi:hypothetical protein [Rhizobium leguminosarum]|uniref:hypothetical protein n=1 Tax=Rhizobium leguminosarum TaxID=384 RepID=UPI0014424E19|nr:hypothetical protein [Rhizobium leguminosarum]MBY5820760.1 hypothetical protein [Rhizobium leguminosarum]NKL80472.1 hypothetical protein [Rhizobium leguminosarum bv. viciae]